MPEKWYLIVHVNTYFPDLKDDKDFVPPIFAIFPIADEAKRWIENQSYSELYRIERSDINIPHHDKWSGA